MSERTAAELVVELADIVGSSAVSTGQSDLETHSHDESTQDPVLPDVVVYPSTTGEVSAILALANERRVPVTAFGAGTSVEGHTVPVAGGVVVDFRDMNQIVELHAGDFQVTVQAGALRLELEEYLRRHGLFFPPDPGANATIGGMIANNAAGVRAVKYGAVRDSVLAMTVVLADGRVIKTGSRSVKQSAGYDLRHLIIGSEGTLGLVTEATLRVAPVPEHFATAIVAFDSIDGAAQAVYEIVGHGLDPAALELIHPDHMRWMNEDEGTDYLEAPTLLVEFSGASETSVADAMTVSRELCVSQGALDVRAGLGDTARAEMWELRHAMRDRYIRRSVGRKIVSVDVSVPISGLPDLVEHGSEASQRLGFEFPIFGHAGDGNLHLAIIHDPDDASETQRAAQLGEELVLKAIELGGTSTGEHGIGIGKRRYLVEEFGHEAVDVMRSIKATLDPNNILNPGKVLPDV